jgi:hypothetical protein
MDRFKVFALRTDWFLDEGSRYEAEFVDNHSDKVRVFFALDNKTHSCIKILDQDVVRVWNGKSSHDPYSFDA